MKKNKQSFNKKWAAYSAMGAAFLATAPEAEGAVVYHDPADVTATFAGVGALYVGVDIDGGIISPVATSSGPVVSNTANELFIGVASNVAAGGQGYWIGMGSTNEVVHNYIRTMAPGSGFPMAELFTSGAMISAGNVGSLGYGFLGVTSGAVEFGKFSPTPVTGFIGVQMNLGGALHYGWVRVTVNSTAPGSVTIHDFAYDDTPGTPIAAGAGAAAVAVPTLSEWGLITLSLFLLSFGMVFIGQKEGILTTGTSSGRDLAIGWKFQRPPLYASLFKKTLLATGVLAAILGVFSYIAYGGITTVDFFGTMIAGPIFAYLMHLLMAFEHEHKKMRENH